MNEALKGLLGLAQRAHRLAFGDEAMEAIQAQKGSVVLLAMDAGANTTKKIQDKCQSKEVPLVMVSSQGELSQAVGRTCVYCVVLDKGFGKSILNQSNK